MSIENTKFTPEQTTPIRFTRRAKLLGGVASGAILATGAALGVNHMSAGPEMEGSKTVRIEPGDTVYGIAKTEVDGGANYTGAVADAIQNDPENEDIFENGSSLGSEDLGKELVIPESVEK